MFSLATFVTTEPRMLNWTLVSTLMLQFAVYRDRRPLPPKPAFLSSIARLKSNIWMAQSQFSGFRTPFKWHSTVFFCQFCPKQNAPFFFPNLLVNAHTFLKGFLMSGGNLSLIEPQILGRRESHREDTFSATILRGPGGLVLVGCSKTYPIWFGTSFSLFLLTSRLDSSWDSFKRVGEVKINSQFDKLLVSKICVFGQMIRFDTCVSFGLEPSQSNDGF